MLFDVDKGSKTLMFESWTLSNPLLVPKISRRPLF